jgi:hypothetical protein
MKRYYLIFSVLLLTYSRLPPRYASLEHFFILPLKEVTMGDSNYQLYVSVSCPFAKQIERELLYYTNTHANNDWSFHTPTSIFPSPTLRIKKGDSYQNYYGAKKIKEVIISLKY